MRIAKPGSIARVERIEARAYSIPTRTPEADGTLSWDKTTLVLVNAEAGGVSGIGHSYADVATAKLIEDTLAAEVIGRDAMDVNAGWHAMVRRIRNLGRPGICSMAISAVDNALWDLKARLLNLPLVKLLGHVRQSVPLYGSGGFTNYSIADLQKQLEGWVDQGIPRVKMKVGSHPEEDEKRVKAARKAIGDDAELFVDANGAYSRKQALAMAERFAEYSVSWFEEPVSSDDLEGLRLLRDRAPAQMEIAAGEYGYDSGYFRRMLEAGAVDVLQADATRCLGLSGFLQAAGLADAFQLPISAHTAPAVHLHACCAVRMLAPLEWFHDHARIEAALFDGAPRVVEGAIAPDPQRPGLGLELNREQLA